MLRRPICYMSAIKDGRLTIELDRERKMLFSLNVLDEMQDKFGGYDKLAEAMQGNDVFKNVRWLLTRLINEGADDGEEEVAEKQVGKMIHAGNLNQIISAIFSAFNMGTVGTPDAPEPEDEEADAAEDEEPKNAESTQV